MEKTWVLYILECGDGTLYTGITDDLDRRLKAHRAGKGAKYTRGRGPLTLRYREECPDHSTALKREIAVKRLTRPQKMELILRNTVENDKSLENPSGIVYNIQKPEMKYMAVEEDTMSKERTLVVLAAGIGSRFGGGIKQLQPAGPGGEVIMDYSIFDAMEAGFNRVIFIIRHDIQDLFEEIIGNRIRAVCEKRGVEVLCAYQEKANLPAGFVCPEDRAKPWGTGHALLSCKGMLNGPFVVVNADDYYGKDAYRKAMTFLDTLEENSTDTYGLVGFRLENTLSDNGGVTRGLCKADENGVLEIIRETKNIIKTPNGGAVQTQDGLKYLDGSTPVSMNMWGFTPDILDRLEQRFVGFLEENLNEAGAEFLIPVEIGRMLEEDRIKVQVLPTDSRWFGMTYVEDMPGVREAFDRMTREGIYPTPLYE